MSLYLTNRPIGGVAFHEAPHAIIGERLGFPIAKAFVVGDSTGGVDLSSQFAVFQLKNPRVATYVAAGAVGARLFAWAGDNPLTTQPPDAIAVVAANDLMEGEWGCGHDGNILRQCHREQNSKLDELAFAVTVCRAALASLVPEWNAVRRLASRLRSEGTVDRTAVLHAMFCAGRPLMPKRAAKPLVIPARTNSAPSRPSPLFAAMSNHGVAELAIAKRQLPALHEAKRRGIRYQCRLVVGSPITAFWQGGSCEIPTAGQS